MLLKNLSISVASMFVLGTPASFAQGSAGCCYGAPVERGDSDFNASMSTGQEVQLSGVVTKILQSTSPSGTGVHLRLNADEALYEIAVGPRWFLDESSFLIKEGDSIEVQGTTLMLDGRAIVIAAWVRKGDQKLILRDLSGRPSWAGWRQQKRRG